MTAVCVAVCTAFPDHADLTSHLGEMFPTQARVAEDGFSPCKVPLLGMMIEGMMTESDAELSISWQLSTRTNAWNMTICQYTSTKAPVERLVYRKQVTFWANKATLE